MFVSDFKRVLHPGKTSFPLIWQEAGPATQTCMDERNEDETVRRQCTRLRHILTDRGYFNTVVETEQRNRVCSSSHFEQCISEAGVEEKQV